MSIQLRYVGRPLSIYRRKITPPRDVAIKIESLREQQASKRVMLTYLEGRPEKAGRAEGTNAMDRLMTQMKQDLKDIARETAILELSRD